MLSTPSPMATPGMTLLSGQTGCLRLTVCLGGRLVKLLAFSSNESGRLGNEGNGQARTGSWSREATTGGASQNWNPCQPRAPPQQRYRSKHPRVAQPPTAACCWSLWFRATARKRQIGRWAISWYRWEDETGSRLRLTLNLDKRRDTERHGDGLAHLSFISSSPQGQPRTRIMDPACPAPPGALRLAEPCARYFSPMMQIRASNLCGPLVAFTGPSAVLGHSPAAGCFPQKSVSSRCWIGIAHAAIVCERRGLGGGRSRTEL